MKTDQSKVLRIQKGQYFYKQTSFLLWSTIASLILMFAFWLWMESDFVRCTTMAPIGIFLWYINYHSLIDTIIEFDPTTQTINLIKLHKFRCFTKKPNVVFQCSVADLGLAHHVQQPYCSCCTLYTFALLCMKKNKALANPDNLLYNEFNATGAQLHIHEEYCDQAFREAFVKLMTTIKLQYSYDFDIIDGTGIPQEELNQLFVAPITRIGKKHECTKPSAEEVITFGVGEVVQVKWGISWTQGRVTSVDPVLLIQIDGQKESVVRNWDQVKKLQP